MRTHQSPVHERETEKDGQYGCVTQGTGESGEQSGYPEQTRVPALVPNLQDVEQSEQDTGHGKVVVRAGPANSGDRAQVNQQCREGEGASTPEEPAISTPEQ